MATEVWSIDRPKGRKPVWACRVNDDTSVVFESRSVSVRLLTCDAARWIAGLVEALHVCKGDKASLDWIGDLDDDCSTEWNQFGAHAEHLQGPRRGGIWYCSVADHLGNRFFHTADRKDIQPRNGDAARWLCELVISSANAGLLEAYTA